MDTKKAIALLFAICLVLLLSLLVGPFYEMPTGFQIMAVPYYIATGEAEYEIAFPFTTYLLLACLLALFALLLPHMRLVRNEKKGK